MERTRDRCAFRLDDITPDMNWDNFNRIRGLFGKYQIKPLLGVVPCNQDKTLSVQAPREDFWEILQGLQEEGYCLAQHGYSHVYETQCGGLLKLNPFSEFAGLPYGTQLKKIRKGKDILQNHGFYVTIFMAPGHTYDKNTLKALKSCGFGYVTDGYSSRCYSKKGMNFIPSRKSKPLLGKGLDTICLHINQMMEQDLKDLERFLHENRRSVIDFTDLLDQENFSKCSPAAFLEEKKNLMIRRIKYFVSTNTTLHTYLEETDGGSTVQKTVKRLAGLPALGIGWVKKR